MKPLSGAALISTRTPKKQLKRYRKNAFGGETEVVLNRNANALKTQKRRKKNKMARASRKKNRR